MEEFQLIAKMLMAPLLDEKDQPNSIKILSGTLKKMNEISLGNMVIILMSLNRYKNQQKTDKINQIIKIDFILGSFNSTFV